MSYWWAHRDLNLGPLGYEPIALTAELWAHNCMLPILYKSVD